MTEIGRLLMGAGRRVYTLVGAVSMMIAAGHSDRTGNRRAHVTIGYFIAGLGFLACVYAPTAPWILAALSLNALGEPLAAGLAVPLLEGLR